jgi:hypothetical protein
MSSFNAKSSTISSGTLQITRGKPKAMVQIQSPKVASNASLLFHFAFSVVDFQWNADSGTTLHMTNCKDCLENT